MIQVQIQENGGLTSYITVNDDGSGTMSNEDREAGWCFFRYIYTRYRDGMPIPGGVTGTVKHLPSNGTPALLKEIFENLETNGAT
jgi:hypothetical protein